MISLDRLQKNPFIFVISLLGAIASIIGLLVYIKPESSNFLDFLTSNLARPWIALSFTVLLFSLIITVAALLWILNKRNFEARSSTTTSQILGRRLFEYEGYYPIDIAPKTNLPSLNSEIFVKAIHFFLSETTDQLAVMDLIYLREDNRQHSVDVLPPEKNDLYEKLIRKYKLEDFRNHFSKENEKLFRNAIRIVNDIGDTLSGTHCEILLHDVRNPLRSIIATKNSEQVSGRRLYDESTRFVVEYLKHQGKHIIEGLKNEPKVAYPKQFTSSKKVKATTTPLYHNRYGLIGLLCFNIDIDAIENMKPSEQRRFFDKYVETFGETPEFEKDNAPVG